MMNCRPNSLTHMYALTDGFKMMHKAWRRIEEVPYCFSRSSIKFQGHTQDKKLLILTRIVRFQTVNQVLIHQWIWNDAQSLTLSRRGTVLFFEVIHQIWRSHGWKIDNLNPIWVRLLGRFQLSNPSDLLFFFQECRPFCSGLNELTHWGRVKRTAFSQTTSSNAFYWMNLYDFGLTFHWILFLVVKFTIFQHWFR